MYIAIQSISWGRQPDVDRMLRQIAEIGYQGVEFAQHPDVLGPPEELLERLISLGLTFVGLSGGSLNEKAEYTFRYSVAALKAKFQPNRAAPVERKVRQQGPYLYIDEWEGPRSVAALAGSTLALHPHMFKSVQTAREAEELLSVHRNLWFLPDTAHLTVAGENVIEVLRRNYDRIIAVHLKDWSAEYGRAYHFYSRGFVELGSGDVYPDEIVSFLQGKGYQEWLVVEQDAPNDPEKSARSSREWLRDKCGI
jgi:inosose dehydratase